jgi:hypothetical protein
MKDNLDTGGRLIKEGDEDIDWNSRYRIEGMKLRIRVGLLEEEEEGCD